MFARSILLPLLAAANFLFLPAVQAQGNGKPQMDLKRVTINAGMYKIDAQVAASPLERQIGLMYRKEMPQQEGMLFVFEQAAPQCFWMKQHPAAADCRLRRRRRTHRQPGGHEAAEHRRLPLLGGAGSLRARNEPGLVRQERTSRRASKLERRRCSRASPLRHIGATGTRKSRPAGRLFALRQSASAQPKFFAAKSQFTSLARKVSTYLGRRLR